MTDPPSVDAKENKFLKGTFAVVGIMSTLVIYGVLQVCKTYIFVMVGVDVTKICVIGGFVVN
jgi:hypothetical protein